MTWLTGLPGRVALVGGALALAFIADVAVGASWPGRIAVVALVASVVLVVGAKSLLSPLVARPVGSRVGELGDPRDDLYDDLYDDLDNGATPGHETHRGTIGASRDDRGGTT